MAGKMKTFRSKSREEIPKMDHLDTASQTKFLGEHSLPLYTNFTGNHRSDVPPMSPKELIFDYNYTRVPKLLPKLKNLKLPYVRDIGIKACIDKLAEYFHCTDYKFNLIQFWFLDIITDCLWKAQDEYQFPEKYQKIILEWILYVFNLIRVSNPSKGYDVCKVWIESLGNPQFKNMDLSVIYGKILLLCSRHFKLGDFLSPNKLKESVVPTLHLPTPEYNLSRKKVFKLFKEAMLLAEDYIQTGCAIIPLPEELFSVHFEEEKEASSTDVESNDSISSDSTISLDSNHENGSYLAIQFEENTEFFKLPEKSCIWNVEDECLSSSEETMSEDDRPLPKIELEIIKDPVAEEVMDEEIAFYKADLSTPPRFKPSQESIAESSSISLDTPSEKASEDSGDAVWRDIPRRPQGDPCIGESQLVPKQSKPKSKSIHHIHHHHHDASILKAWYEYYLWQKRAEDMADPKVGWAAFAEENKKEFTVSDNFEDIDAIKSDWIQYIKEAKRDVRKTEETVFINTCVLMAIKQFVFDYFYESFQYTLVRLAFRYPHHLITQAVNDVWRVPKLLKAELKKPKPKKPKKEKVKKEKPKKEKKPKQPKEKSSKKSKSSKGTREKKEKPKQLTKEQKAELARLKKEKDLEEENKRIAELNRRFMFPLSDAATDAFYKQIFENWVKVEKAAKGKKKNK